MTQMDELQLPEGFGSPTGSASQYTTWKLKAADDRLVLRILPAWMRCLLDRNDFGLFWGDHYGYFGKDAKDPSKKSFKVFTCIEEKNFGRVVQECPECKYIVANKQKFEDLKLQADKQVNELIARGKAKGASEAEITKAASKLREKLTNEMTPLREWLKSHNCNKKFRIPCIDKQGQVGIFTAPYGIVIKLREEIKKLRERTYPGTDRPIEAGGRKGVFFEIVRAGQASPQSDSVRPLRIVRESDGAEILDFHVISNEQLEQARRVIPDLEELKARNHIRTDQIEALVVLDKAGGGSCDPIEVDSIFGTSVKSVVGEKEPDWLSNDTSTESSVKTESQQTLPEETFGVAVGATDTPPAPAPKETSLIGDDDFEAAFA